jgi:hypothetical protein
MRTEAILEQFGATESSWKEVAEANPQAQGWGFIASETPCYVGRAIAAVAADPDRRRFSGGVFSSGTLSEIYPFTDLDGSRPNMNHYLRAHHPDLMKPRGDVAEWAVSSPPAPA